MRWLGLLAALSLGAPLAAVTTYPMEGGSLLRENRSLSTATLAMPLNLQWTASSCGSVSRGNPVILADRVVQAYQNKVLCYDRATGSVIWNWSTNGIGDLWNPPAFDEARGLLYQAAYNGAVVALRASDGAPQWSRYEGHAPHSWSLGSATYFNDRVYHCNANGDLVCLDADTQVEQWRHSCYRVQGLGTPAIDGGRIYLGGLKGELACLDAATGAIHWRLSGTATTAYPSSVMLNATHLFVMNSKGKVESRFRADGSLAWEYQTDSYTFSNLSTDGVDLYATSDDRCIHKLNMGTGTLIWKKCFTGNFARSGPFYFGQAVFAAGCTGEYYGVDSANGNTVWAHTHGLGNSFNDWAEADGDLFGADNNGVMRCFRSGGLVASQTPTLTSTPSHTPVVTATVTPSATASSTITPSITPSATPTQTASITPSATRTSTSTASPSITPSVTGTSTSTLSPSQTPTYSSTTTATLTSTISATPTMTQTPNAALTATAVAAAATLTAIASPLATAVAEDPAKDSYVAPNPVTNGTCDLVYRMERPGKARARIFQASGDQVGKATFEHAGQGIKRSTLDLHSYAPGVYFYILNKDYNDGSKEKLPLRKFIVTK